MIPLFTTGQSLRRRLRDRRCNGITTAFIAARGRRFRGYADVGSQARRIGVGARLYEASGRTG